VLLFKPVEEIFMTEQTLTAIYEEAEEGGYIGYVAELPGANTQGETLEETRENLSEAIQLILETNREEFEKRLTPSARVTRERMVLRAA
jgi:predicted RNase H-like HicB family nuclease